MEYFVLRLALILLGRIGNRNLGETADAQANCEPFRRFPCPVRMSEDTTGPGDPPKRRRKRRSVSEPELAEFIRQYGRKAPRRGEPNDRGYSREVEEKIKRMAAEELDRLLNGNEDDAEQKP